MVPVPANENAPPPLLAAGQVWRDAAGVELAIVRAVDEEFERIVTYFVLTDGTRLRQRTAPVREFVSAYAHYITDLRELITGPIAS